MTAQLGRRDDRIKELEAEINKRDEAKKTETQKLIDSARAEAVEQFKKDQYEPIATSAQTYEAYFEREAKRLLEGIPEEKRGGIQLDGLSPFQQFQVLQAFRSFDSGKPASVGAGANPTGDPGPKTIKGSEFRAWQVMDKHNPRELAKYDEMREEMVTAYREKRIDWNK